MGGGQFFCIKAVRSEKVAFFFFFKAIDLCSAALLFFFPLLQRFYEGLFCSFHSLSLSPVQIFFMLCV